MVNKFFLSIGVVVLAILSTRWYTAYEAGRTFNRVYRNSTTVQDEYNSWTQDGILEYYWGHHIHLGYYPPNIPPNTVDFRESKRNMTVQLFEWAHRVTNRPLPNSNNNNNNPSLSLFDVGCGFGGSSMLLTSKYDLSSSIGITLSDFQVARANEILLETIDKYPNNNKISYYVADVLKIDITNELRDKHFDIVWCLEMEPHVPDKKAMINQLLKALKPGGLLILGCWNVRDTSNKELNNYEKELVKLLEIEWGHPYFWSIKQYEDELSSNKDILSVYGEDWSKYTNPSWWESIIEMIRRPKMLFWAIVHPSCWNDRWGDLMGLINMNKAFADGLMQYGVFAIVKK